MPSDLRGATVVPIPAFKPGLFAVGRELIQGVSNSTWFTPGLPVPPQAPVTEAPRRLDYPTGINIQYVPRGEEQIGYDQLRNLAEIWDLLRLVIETRKDQIAGIPWIVRPRKDPDEKNVDYKQRTLDDKRVDVATAFWQRPDGEHLWQTWIRTLLEEMFVVDALSLYPFKKATGNWCVDVLDGGTIKRLLDAQGRTPDPPSMAYEQIIKGVPAFGFRADQLFYRPRNQRSWKIYGFSQVEQIVITINLAVRRQMYKLNYYTMGNMPEAIVQMPDTWPPDRIKQFQEWWNSMLAGQLDTRRQFFFVPGFGGKDAISYPKQDAIKDEMDEWLARVVCYTFSVSPQPFVREGMSRYGVQQQAQMSKAEGLLPTLSWISEVLTDLMENGFGWKGLEFVFQEDVEPDPLKRAQIQEIRARTGLSQIDEIREENGDEPIGVGAGIITGSGFLAFPGQSGTIQPALQPGLNPDDGSPPPTGGSNGNGGGNGNKPTGDTQPPKRPDEAGRVIKRRGAGGGQAFDTLLAQHRRERLAQALRTHLADMARQASAAIASDYGRHMPVTRKIAGLPLETGDRPLTILIHGDDTVRADVRGTAPLEKTATTTGVRQSTGAVHYDLEGGRIEGAADAAKVAAAVVDSFLRRQADLGLDREALHLDLADALKSAFQDLKFPEAPPAPPAPDVTVNVAPAAAPAVTVKQPDVDVKVILPDGAVTFAEGAVQVSTPPTVVQVPPQPPPTVVNQLPVQPAPAVTVVNKQKRPKVKVKLTPVVKATLAVAKTRKVVKRNVLGEIEAIESAPEEPPPPLPEPLK